MLICRWRTHALRFRHRYLMRRLFFASIFLILLTGCQSKRDICTDSALLNITCGEAKKKLGLKYKGEGTCGVVANYCEFFYEN